MYCLISKNYENTKRGAFTTAQRFKRDFPEYIDAIDIDNIKNISDIRKDYSRLVFSTQAPHRYGGMYGFTKQDKCDIVYLRRDFFPGAWVNSTSNGFAYYKESPKIKSYIPQFTTSGFKCNPSQDVIVLGFYYRPSITTDSCAWFFNFLFNLKIRIHLFTFGNRLQIDSCDLPPRVMSHTHTYNNEYFFSKITHYIHFKSNTFCDPFPNALLEAVDLGAQIIITENERPFKDGIDDVASCVKYHTTLTDRLTYNNSHTILKGENFRDFYLKLFNNNFEYTFNRDKYANLNEWCLGEL